MQRGWVASKNKETLSTKKEFPLHTAQFFEPDMRPTHLVESHVSKLRRRQGSGNNWLLDGVIPSTFDFVEV